MNIYCKNPLGDHTKDIRLLLIQEGDGEEVWCSMTTKRLGDYRNEYIAISYTWGDANVKKTIWVNKQPIQVPYNAWYALQQVRLHGAGRLYWIDSVCIDQSNYEERNAQVSIMDRIFSSAIKVAACIGPLQEDFKDYYDVACVSRSQRSSDLATLADDYITALDRLSRRTYAQRIWIIQELLLAQWITICCGEASVDLDSLVPSKLFLRCYRTGRLKGNPLAQIFMDVVIDRPKYWACSLPAVVLRYADRKCSDPRDKVYSLMSLAQDRRSKRVLEINYDKPVFGVLEDYIQARCSISHMDLCDFGVVHFGIARLVQEFSLDLHCHEALQDFAFGSNAFARPDGAASHLAVMLPEGGRAWDNTCCGILRSLTAFPTSFVPIDLFDKGNTLPSIPDLCSDNDLDTPMRTDSAISLPTLHTTAPANPYICLPIPKASPQSILHLPPTTRRGDYLLSMKLKYTRAYTSADAEETTFRFVCRPSLLEPGRWDIVSKAEITFDPIDLILKRSKCGHGVFTSRPPSFAKFVLSSEDPLRLAVPGAAFRGSESYVEVLEKGSDLGS